MRRLIEIACLSLLVAASALKSQVASTRDSTAIAKLQRADPCPQKVPAVWLVPDSMLRSSWHCSLVAATARLLSTSANPLYRAGLDHAVCVTVHAFEFERIPAGGTRDAYWTVEFADSSGNAVGARVDRQSGTMSLATFSNEFRYPASVVCDPSVNSQ
jgi:hypothetical protein